MDALDELAARLYLVTTTSARYLIDLDRMLISRAPAEPSEGIRNMREDNEPVALLRLVRCRVDLPMVLDIHFRVPGVVLTRRTSTEVLCIEPLETALVPAE